MLLEKLCCTIKNRNVYIFLRLSKYEFSSVISWSLHVKVHKNLNWHTHTSYLSLNVDMRNVLNLCKILCFIF